MENRNDTTKLQIIVLLVLMLLVANTPQVSAQMTNGNYTFSNSKVILTFTIKDDGWTIDNARMFDKLTGEEEKQIGGEFMKPPHSAIVWYQFQTATCNYSFDTPKKTLSLERYDCRDGKLKEQKIQLKKNVSR